MSSQVAARLTLPAAAYSTRRTPHAAETSTPAGLTFTRCTLSARYTRVVEVAATAERVLLRYEARARNCFCGRWSVHVVWPRDVVRVHLQSVEVRQGRVKVRAH